MGGEIPLVERATPAAISIERFIQQFEKHYGLNPSYRLAVSFSMGAALLSVVLWRSPNLFAAVGLHAEFVIRTPDTDHQGDLPRVLIAHGSEDEIVGVERAREGDSRVF